MHIQSTHTHIAATHACKYGYKASTILKHIKSVSAKLLLTLSVLLSLYFIFSLHLLRSLFSLHRIFLFILLLSLVGSLREEFICKISLNCDCIRLCNACKWCDCERKMNFIANNHWIVRKLIFKFAWVTVAHAKGYCFFPSHTNKIWAFEFICCESTIELKFVSIP